MYFGKYWAYEVKDIKKDIFNLALAKLTKPLSKTQVVYKYH